ncbi:hypothetical protein TrVFT333_006751 [Trichoderma virens FT-333]|nr:hypothetical protein TrVFT333_006751 [Trichoderma virens FT-333]
MDCLTAEAVNNQQNSTPTELLTEGSGETIAGTNNSARFTDDPTKFHEDNAVGSPSHDMDETKFDIIAVHGRHGDEKSWEMPSASHSLGSTKLNNVFNHLGPVGGRLITIPMNYNSDEDSMECYTIHHIYSSAHRLLTEVAKRRMQRLQVCLTTSL